MTCNKQGSSTLANHADVRMTENAATLAACPLHMQVSLPCSLARSWSAASPHGANVKLPLASTRGISSECNKPVHGHPGKGLWLNRA